VREDAASNSDVAADPAPVEPAFVLAALPAAGVATVEDALPVAPSVQITTASKSHRVQTEKEGVSSIEIFDECLVPEICIDRYLWALYERAPKVDAAKVVEEIKETVEKNGKPKTITKKVTRYVDQDFTWKDPKAAERARMPLQDYVIGGMDRNFKLKLYRALRALDDAGLSPGITSAFRDDYRQSLASGYKAGVSNSLHGGSRRTGGYGHGRAIDITGPEGRESEVWKWIDAHGAKYGLHRPLPGPDPAHVQQRGDWHRIALALRESRTRSAAGHKAKVAATRAKAKVRKTGSRSGRRGANIRVGSLNTDTAAALSASASAVFRGVARSPSTPTLRNLGDRISNLRKHASNRKSPIGLRANSWLI